MEVERERERKVLQLNPRDVTPVSGAESGRGFDVTRVIWSAFEAAAPRRGDGPRPRGALENEATRGRAEA